MAQSLASFRRELDVFIDEELGPAGQKEIFIAIVTEQLAEFERAWRAALEKEPEFQRFVDGRETQSLQGVAAPGSTVVERVRPIGPIVDRALELFELFTKVVTGKSKSEIYAFVNNARTPLAGAEAAPGDQVAIASLSDWNWRAEVRAYNDKNASGFSNGLFESVAAVLKREFRGSTVPIRFAGRSFDGVKAPAVLIG